MRNTFLMFATSIFLCRHGSRLTVAMVRVCRRGSCLSPWAVVRVSRNTLRPDKKVLDSPLHILWFEARTLYAPPISCNPRGFTHEPRGWLFFALKCLVGGLKS